MLTAAIMLPGMSHTGLHIKSLHAMRRQLKGQDQHIAYWPTSTVDSQRVLYCIASLLLQVRAFHSITYINSVHHNRKPSASSAGHPAAAADPDGCSTSESSTLHRQGSSSSSYAHATPRGTAPALRSINSSPFAAANKSLPGSPAATAAADTAAAASGSNQQHTAAASTAAPAGQPAVDRAAESTLTSSADAYGTTYDTTCSSIDMATLDLQSVDHRSSSSRECRAETWIVLVRRILILLLFLQAIGASQTLACPFLLPQLVSMCTCLSCLRFVACSQCIVRPTLCTTACRSVVTWGR
jgi:hypothetical protein